MKKVIVFIALVGTIVSLRAQDFVADVSRDQDEVISGNDMVRNQDYLEAVQAVKSPVKASHIQSLLSTWKLESQKQFQDRKELCICEAFTGDLTA
ncbi:MAG: hypothetical protein AAFP76_15415 [Bacteroidota bacterium]